MSVESTPWGESQSAVVPGISAPSSVACLRSLGKRGIRTIAASSDETTPAFSSRYCDEAVLVPSPHDDLVAYKDALLSLAMRPDVQTIIPVREEDVYVLARYREEFEEHVSTLWPEFDTLADVQDRIRLFEAAENAGVGVPETRLLDDDEIDWEREQEWIVKARYSILGDGYVDCEPESCVAPPSTRYLPPGATPDIDSISAEMGHVPIVQEFMPTTDEYGFFALYDHGEPLATFQHRQRRGWSYAGGPSAFRESVRIPDLEESGLSLLDELDWHGLAMIEFLRDEETGEFKLMEINPRFWSSLPFSVRAGADFPYYYWLLATDNTDRIDHEYRANIGGHLLRGELLYLHSVLTDEVDLVEPPAFSDALSDVAESLWEHPRFDYLQRDDVRPFFRDMRNTYGAFRDQ
ncbi:carboxylate--amine ligase [Natronoglomus mannanivorans]|uniref:Carboxylate--amine ligase n=1 Tax=Natronoglomus mannanivorans TaxID=2979990 RepID=A0AAP2YY81_9EURY|nr:carboxylate--amine ligase [Halobacteria archaeon AArc-xg1-1]